MCEYLPNPGQAGKARRPERLQGDEVRPVQDADRHPVLCEPRSVEGSALWLAQWHMEPRLCAVWDDRVETAISRVEHGGAL